MSKIISLLDGKISHQITTSKPKCARCSKLIENPAVSGLQGFETYTEIDGKNYKHSACQLVYHYITTTEDKRDYYIYPTKSGRSIVYCSDYCRKIHNHRFHAEQSRVVKFVNALINHLTKE